LKCLCALSLLLLILCGATLAPAQSTDATISGVVVDPAGRVIPDAAIEIVNDATGVHYSGETNGAGIYTLTILPPGQYRLQVSKAGFKTLIKPGITLNVQSAVAINFTLPIGATSESVTVEAGASTINTSDGSVSTVIDRNFVENMPLNGRSFQSLMTLVPGVAQVAPPDTLGVGNNVGVNGEIVVNGQRTESNYFSVDGVSANTGANTQFGGGAGAAGAVASETALGTTQSLVSIDALQEFRATTSTYSAEYGRTPGGQFSFTTRSGSKAWHGSAYDYLRNDAMDANNWFNDFYDYPKEKERQNDFGGTLGGSVYLPHVYDGRERTFFFVSYEGLRLDSPQAATPTAVPDVALRQGAPSVLQPVLNAFPIPNDGEDGLNDGFAYYIEAVSDPATLDNTSVRIDHSFSDTFKVFGRYADTPSSLTSYNAATKDITGLSNHTVTLGSTNIFSPRQSNELRFNFTDAGAQSMETSTNLGGATTFNLSGLSGPGGNGFPTNGSELLVLFEFGNYVTFDLQNIPSEQQQLNLTDVYNWAFARHSIKFGIDWRRLATTLTPINPQEEVLFRDETQILTNTPPAIAVQSQAPGNVVPVYLAFSSFVQDEWKASARLAVSLGLRWDINPAPYSVEGPSPYNVTQITSLATTGLAPAGTPLWNTDWLGFAPRVGFAYTVRNQGDHATVLRAGGGVFYDMGNTQGSIGYNGVGIKTAALVTGGTFPLTSAQLAVPAPSIAAPYNGTVFAFDPNLKLPYSLQYNLAVEQAMGKQQSLTINYVGSAGRRLLTEFFVQPASLGNTNFTASGELALTQGRASSGYNSLQLKYQRQLSHGLQGLASYTWSHSLDDASSNFGVFQLLRASSDFDIRHNVQAALTYEMPMVSLNGFLGALSNHWGMDMRLQARSSVPVDILGLDEVDPTTGTYLTFQPNRVPGQPSYLFGAQYPGGRILNYNAFQQSTTDANGDLPRNAGRAFDAIQVDTALHREFQLHEHTQLQFRAESFNLFNHPNFGAIYNELADGPGVFGYAYSTLNSSLGGLNPLYQVGGPRSLQLSLRLSF
jgi:Carboxypeptidase regulatory-like domain